MIFKNREEAGQLLAKALIKYENNKNAIILGLPRGGVPVAAEVSKKLNLPLDIFLVRKLGTPGHEELAMGAIAMGGMKVLNQEVIDMLSIPKETIDRVIEAEQKELKRRDQLYRGNKTTLKIEGQIIILIDDGLATGATMRAAVAAVKTIHPKKVIVAVPVSPEDTYREFKAVVDEIVCLHIPEYFAAVGQFYNDFSQTSDEDVRKLLKGQN